MENVHRLRIIVDDIDAARLALWPVRSEHLTENEVKALKAIKRGLDRLHKRIKGRISKAKSETAQEKTPA